MYDCIYMNNVYKFYIQHNTEYVWLSSWYQNFDTFEYQGKYNWAKPGLRAHQTPYHLLMYMYISTECTECRYA